MSLANSLTAKLGRPIEDPEEGEWSLAWDEPIHERLDEFHYLSLKYR